MADSNSEITVVKLDVTDTEQTGTLDGDLTNFGGFNVVALRGEPADSGSPLVTKYQLSFFTTGAVLGITAQYHYRKVRVPHGTDPFVISNFFTNVDLSFDNAIFIIEADVTDEYVDYHIFYIWQAVGTTSNLDLYVQQDAVDESASQIITFPTFPNSTDPVRGNSNNNSQAAGNRIVDTFLVAQPPP